MSQPTRHHPIARDAAPSGGPEPERTRERSAVRWELVARVRGELARGTYPLELAWARTLERVGEALEQGGVP